MHFISKAIDFLNRKFIFIAKSFLWFHRIIGLTFGGLAINSSGNISINRFYKFYGFCITAFSICLDIYGVMNLLFDEKTKINNKKFIGDSKTMEKFHIIITVMIAVLKNSLLININYNGIKIINILDYNLKDYIKHKINLSICLIFFVWFSHLIIIFSIIL